MHATNQCNHLLVIVVTLAMLQEYEQHGIFRGCCSVGFRWQDMENTHLREHLQVCHSHASKASTTVRKKKKRLCLSASSSNSTDSFGYIMSHLYCYTLQQAEAAQALARLHCTLGRRCTLSGCIMRLQKAGFSTASTNSTTHCDESKCNVSDCATQTCSMKGAAMTQPGLQSC